MFLSAIWAASLSLDWLVWATDAEAVVLSALSMFGRAFPVAFLFFFFSEARFSGLGGLRRFRTLATGARSVGRELSHSVVVEGLLDVVGTIRFDLGVLGLSDLLVRRRAGGGGSRPGALAFVAGRRFALVDEDRIDKKLWFWMVYSRACGGTQTRSTSSKPCRGLSPRVRGNRSTWGVPSWGRRSIPARAGEPRSWMRLTCLHEVYPRACGGTQGTHGRCNGL